MEIESPLPPVPTAPYVFVSYASADRTRVLAIVEKLRTAGPALWVDQAGITGGAAYGAEIAAALQASSAVVLMCSATSLASRNVRQELMLAWRYDRPILPLLLEPIAFPDDVAYWLEGAQWIEVLDRPEAAWLPLVERAYARLGIVRSGWETLDSAPRPDHGKVAPDHPTNLPATEGELIGRDREVRELLALLAHGRWITLTGPGGTGKTRLAIEVVRRIALDCPGGAWFLDLSGTTDPSMLLPALAAALDVVDEPNRSLLAAIAARFGPTRAVLLLDNLEQIPGVGTVLTDLGARCPELVIVATSRVPLRADGEWVYAVGQLDLPDVRALPPFPVLGQNPAVRLFVNRARLSRRDFVLADANARAVAEICVRLDGLPLAIELAAARVRLLPPAAILARLGSRLNLLTRGEGAGRQHTLRDTIAWSYDLLSPAEQTAFRRFALFAGGATVEAAEVILAAVEAPARPALDELHSLLDHSLLRADTAGADGGVRLTMLETIRAFAEERLADDDVPRLRAAHARYFFERVAALEPDLSGPRPGTAFAELRRDEDNARVALDWFATIADGEAESEAELHFASAMAAYWRRLGRFGEARAHLRGALDRRPAADPSARATALDRSGFAAARLGDAASAQQDYREALAIWRLVSDRRAEAMTLQNLAEVTEFAGEFGGARELREDVLAIHRERHDPARIAVALHDLGMLPVYQGDHAAARSSLAEALPLYRQTADARGIATALNDIAIAEMLAGDGDPAGHAAESVAIWRTIDDQYAVANALGNLGRALQLAGRYAEAIPPLRESLEMAGAMGDTGALGLARYGLGLVALATGDLDTAHSHLAESLRLAHAAEAPWHVAERLEALAAWWMARRHDAERAARLIGGAAALREQGNFPVPPAEQADLDLTRAAASTLDPTAFAAATDTGRTLSLDGSSPLPLSR